MSHQRSFRDNRKDTLRYNNDSHENETSSMVENETENYSKHIKDNLNRPTTSSDSQFEYTNMRSKKWKRERRNSAQEKLPYETRSTMSTSRNKSIHSFDMHNSDSQQRRRLSRHRRNDDSSVVEKFTTEYTDSLKRNSNKNRRSKMIASDNSNSLQRKKRKKRYGSSEQVELPITDILKRAQESRTKYEEPILLPELATDTIYVQSRNGFNAVKVVKEHAGSHKEFEEPEECNFRPIKVAIIMQKAWKCTGFIYQGLLGGMAFMHFILLQTFFEDSVKFITNYCVLSEIYTNVFSFLITMCVISIFDKFDVAHIDFDHLRQIYTNYAKSAIAIFLYVAAFCLHQITQKTNDKLSLIYYKSFNNSVEDVLKNNTSINSVIDELVMWQKITVSKDVLVVLAWIFISLSTQDDMLLANLKKMALYADDSNFST